MNKDLNTTDVGIYPVELNTETIVFNLQNT